MAICEGGEAGYLGASCWVTITMTIKVLHLIDSGGVYGAEMVLLNLVEEQVKAGVKPLILSAGTPDIDEKPLEKAARERGLPVKKWRMKAGLNLPEAWKILKFAKREGVQILHSHGYKFNLLMGVWPKSIRKIPLIATLHGYVNAPRYSKMWFYELFDKAMLVRMEKVVVVNPAMQALSPLHKMPAKVELIENGITIQFDVSQSTLDPEVEGFFKQHNLVIGAVGRLSKEKGLNFLIEAFANLRPHFENIGLLILGEGRERANLENDIARLGLQGAVLLPGYRENPASYISRLRCLAMPSLTEGLPITLLEAMSLNVPVIGSRVGGIPEVLEYGQYGWLVEPGNSTDLFETLFKVLNDVPQATCKAKQAAIHVRQNYTSVAMSEAYKRVYIGLIAGPASYDEANLIE